LTCVECESERRGKVVHGGYESKRKGRVVDGGSESERRVVDGGSESEMRGRVVDGGGTSTTFTSPSSPSVVVASPWWWSSCSRARFRLRRLHGSYAASNKPSGL